MQKFKVIGRDIVHRWEGNPFLTPEDMDFKCSDIHNAGVACYEGKTLLLVTVESLMGDSSLHLAAEEKYGRFRIETRPFLPPPTDARTLEHESHGVCDARITFLEDAYYIMYGAHGNHGFRLGLARTKDFEEVERLGLVSEPDTKGGAMFPARIRGRYARLERPGEGKSLWVSYSEDLVHWGGSERILSPRGGFWDASWVGVGCPPIEIDRGWLIIYYGAKGTSAGPIYRLGAAIIGKDNPTEVVGRSNIPILAPRELYERIGDQPNIVFTTGALLREKGELKIYYGAARSGVCFGTTSVQRIVDNCLESEEQF